MCGRTPMNTGTHPHVPTVLSLSPQTALRAMTLLSVPCTEASTRGNLMWSVIKEDPDIGICIQVSGPYGGTHLRTDKHTCAQPHTHPFCVRT